MRNPGSGWQLLAAAAMAAVIALPLILRTDVCAQSAPIPSNSAPASQVPQPQEGGVNWQGVGYGVGTLAADVFYVPAKFVYAALGGLFGGGAYVATGGNRQTAETIWRSSLGGDYVVTPDMIAGKEPVHFSGPTSTAPVQPDTTVKPVTAP